jgi:hypothetical protein
MPIDIKTAEMHYIKVTKNSSSLHAQAIEKRAAVNDSYVPNAARDEEWLH